MIMLHPEDREEMVRLRRTSVELVKALSLAARHRAEPISSWRRPTLLEPWKYIVGMLDRNVTRLRR